MSKSLDDLGKRMLHGCHKLCAAASRLGNINLSIVVDPGNVPCVRPALDGYNATMSVVYDGVQKYDAWTTSKPVMPVKFGLSLDEAAKLLIEDYTSHKRRMLARKFNADNRRLDEYFMKMHNGYGVNRLAS